jgi:hypothetical protein
MKNTNKKSAKSTNKVLVNKLIKKDGKLNINTEGNLVIENVKKIEDELIVEKLIELKKAFGFLCLIKDVRAINLFEDCGYGGKTLYLNLKDLNYYHAQGVNGHYYYKGNNYALVLKAGKVSWMDLWKTIEALVRLSTDGEEFIIDTFEVRESSKHKLYVEDIVNFKVFCVYDGEGNDDDC